MMLGSYCCVGLSCCMWSVYSFRLVGDGNETSMTREVDVCLGGVECVVCEGRKRGCKAGVFFFFF